MNLRLKVLMLAIVPLILAIAAISTIANYQAAELSEQEIAVFEQSMLKAKKAELVNYVSLALTSIDHLYNSSLPASPDDEAKAKKLAKRILNRLSYGTDGYFFVYDYAGNNLVHPKQRWRVGNNYWNLEDKDGRKVIQNLIDQARKGGGYYRYAWEQPSRSEVTDKIGYAVGLKRWGWMLGTGIYIGDVVQQVEQAKAGVAARIRETFVLISGITLAAILGVFITGIAINMHETRLADTKLQALTHKIVATQEEERGRVARELHDGISQVLVSVKFTLESAKILLLRSEGDPSSAIERAAENLNVAIREVRRISHDLRPGILDDLGLARALENLAENFANRSGIQVNTDATSVKDAISDDAKTTLYRIAQEALTNIERHADATRADIALSVTRRGVALRIADDGSGFNIDERAINRPGNPGIGLKNMRERLEPFDGQLVIASSANGTAVEARIPRRSRAVLPDTARPMAAAS